MKEFILIFDIPKDSVAVAVRSWRYLTKLGAKKVQHSVWKSDRLQDLIDIAAFIKKSGGSASILEERLVF